MFHEVWVNVLVALIVALILALTAHIVRFLRSMRKLVVWMSKQMANDQNGSWRSNIDRRLTAIETALPGVLPKPEPPSHPPISVKEQSQ